MHAKQLEGRAYSLHKGHEVRFEDHLVLQLSVGQDSAVHTPHTCPAAARRCNCAISQGLAWAAQAHIKAAGDPVAGLL